MHMKSCRSLDYEFVADLQPIPYIPSRNGSPTLTILLGNHYAPGKMRPRGQGKSTKEYTKD